MLFGDGLEGVVLLTPIHFLFQRGHNQVVSRRHRLCRRSLTEHIAQILAVVVVNILDDGQPSVRGISCLALGGSHLLVGSLQFLLFLFYVATNFLFSENIQSQR